MPALTSKPHLLPCPFCGNDLESKWDRMNPSARCVTPDCLGGKLPVLNLDVPASVDAWNTRTEPAVLDSPSSAATVAEPPFFESLGKAQIREQQEAAFLDWWSREGQFGRSGGGDYERTFAFNAWCAASSIRLVCGSLRSSKNAVSLNERQL